MENSSKMPNFPSKQPFSAPLTLSEPPNMLRSGNLAAIEREKCQSAPGYPQNLGFYIGKWCF
jgi:hypothetical protein